MNRNADSSSATAKGADATPALIWKGQALAVDARGYLLDRDAWEPGLAESLAQADGIQLTEEHWQVLNYLRDYFTEFGASPPMRLLLKALAQRLGPDWGDSRRLYRLFPQGPAKQASRYAGLPRPVSCI